MLLEFKSLTNRKAIDLIPYVKHFIATNEDTHLYVGTDSQAHGGYTHFTTVIVLHNRTKGGHVLYTDVKLKRITDEYTYLWKELEQSIEVAQYLTSQGIQKPDFIDIDMNPDPKYRSNSLLRSAVGYVEALGFTPRVKPDSMAATHVADALCRA